MPRYLWASPHEWLLQHDDLSSPIARLLLKVDGDDIQDEYQDQMVEDGYFVNLNDAGAIEAHLEGYGDRPDGVFARTLAALRAEYGCDDPDEIDTDEV